MQYATHDAFVAIAIFFEIVNHKVTFSSQELESITWSSVVPLCQGIIDIPYKFKPRKNNMLINHDESPAHSSGSRSSTSGPTKNFKARQTIKYHNIKLIAPDGTLLSMCNKKKAEWYINQDIGEVVCEDPFTVRLKFEPKGVPGRDKQYNLMRKENRCVVCGREDMYIKKNIVPHEYKKFYPKELKSHASHVLHVLLLCIPCHQISWNHDTMLRQQLIQEYSAPITSANSTTASENSRHQICSHAKTLLRNLKTKAIPQERVEALEATIKDFYHVEEASRELLEKAASMQTKRKHKNFADSHGEKVVMAIIDTEGCEGLLKFDRRWRQHFVDSMQPKFLPELCILKVGVATLDDAIKLNRDYNMRSSGCVDLRHVVVRHVERSLRNQCYGAGLSKLAKLLIDVTLSKSFHIRCSNWEAFQLSWQQMQYATHDAFVAVAIFFEAVNYKMTFSDRDLDSVHWASVVPLCQGIVDVKFSFKPKKGNNLAAGDASPTHHMGSNNSNSNSGRYGPTKAYKARQTPMYHNCKLIAPDGTLLCTCDRKKAQWYLYKDIGVVECEDPFTVRLKFTPKGTPGPDRMYYLTEKENKCVVCGRDDSYIRKNIVPHEYKKFFPEYLKNHSSHDVLLLCLPCHQNSWMYDSTLRKQLVEEYNAPISSANAAMVIDNDKTKVCSHAKGLLRHLKTKSLPQDRVQELEMTIKEFYHVEEITKELLEEASNIQTKKPNREYSGSHGEKVVKAIMEKEGCGGLVKFEKRWRHHFVEYMQPKCLPELWSVDHVHESVVGRLKDIENGFVFDGTETSGAVVSDNHVWPKK